MYAAVDLETTGLEAHKCGIVQVAIILADEDLAVQEEHEWLVNPGGNIPKAAMEVHGITNEDVQDAPSFAGIAGDVQDLLEDRTLVMHNALFDLQVLDRHLTEAGYHGVALHDVACTLQVERFVNGHDLASTYERYTNQPLSDAHDAMTDALACLAVLRHQLSTRTLNAEQALMREILREMTGLEPVDPYGKLVKDADGVVRFAFGKFNGEPVRDHPDYVEWMMGNGFPEAVKHAAKQEVS